MNFRKVLIDLIVPNPDQPRRAFAGVDELAASIAEQGLLEPIMVRRVGQSYQIIHGERRWRAAKQAGLRLMPVIVRKATDAEAFRLAVVENVQRENLTPLEEAHAFERLQQQGMTQAAVGKLVGKGQSYVAHKLRLLRLPEPLTFYLEAGVVSENHVRQVQRLRDIYGPDLTRQFGDGLEPYGGDNPVEASALLLGLRPDGQVAYPGPATPLVMGGLRRFGEYVVQHGDRRVPQWVVAAFYWLSVAALNETSVALLTQLLDAWRDRHESNLLYWLVNRDRTPEDAAEARYWWAVHHDLRHSAALGCDIHDAAVYTAATRAHERDSYAWPSEFAYALGKRQRERPLEEHEQVIAATADELQRRAHEAA